MGRCPVRSPSPFDGDIRVQEDGLSQAAYRGALPPENPLPQRLSSTLGGLLKLYSSRSGSFMAGS